VAAFQPFTTQFIEEISKILEIHATNATIPDMLLPRRVRLDCCYRDRGGRSWRQYYLTAERGPVAQISFPDAPGDGIPSLRMVEQWLDRHGYHSISDPLDGIFERA
jgi:hypothetical protein